MNHYETGGLNQYDLKQDFIFILSFNHTNWTKFIKKKVVNSLDRGVLNAIFSQRERFLDIIRIITYNAKGIEKYSLYELNFFKDFNLEERPLSKKSIRERTPKTPIKKESTQTSQLSLFD